MTEFKRESLFIPAKRGRGSEDVALQIEAAILGGKIPPGQGLPSEREMQEQFKTGRGVIREALRTLKERGLLEIRKGAKGGAYVKQLEVANVSRSLALFLKMHPFDPEHVIEFRESIDHTLTMLAIGRGTTDEKQTLLRMAEDLERAAKNPATDLETLGEMDRELNITFSRLARNPLFEWVMAALQQGFSSQDFALYEEPGYRVETAENWVETARQIAANEPIKALSSISHHYVLLRRRIGELARESETKAPPRDAEPRQGPLGPKAETSEEQWQ
jgi:GntR family transcriptional regulator, transcriptional repressor for pyruvate dehydrogenase complex